MKAQYFIAATACVLLFSSCLTIHQKKIVEAPYVPPVVEGADQGDIEKVAKVYFSTEDIPSIDGKFNEWEGLDGVHVRRMVYGGLFDPANTDGYFKLRADSEYIYLYANVTDNDAAPNAYAASQAWRGDSIEFFFGTDLMPHTFYKQSDHRVRIIPKSKTAIYSYDLAINDVSMKNDEIKCAIVFDDNGYTIEARLPFSLMGIKSLKPKQKVRCDFQINDADGGKERTRLIHWNSPKDNTYLDASAWGDGVVVEFPVEQ
jgi:hypothetical protein